MTKYAEPLFPAIGQMLTRFDTDLLTVLGAQSQNLKGILDHGISFLDNLDVSLVSVQSHATPGTEFSVAHQLGKVPQGYIVYGQTGAGSVYDGATTNSKTTLYLKSDAAAVTYRLIVF